METRSEVAARQERRAQAHDTEWYFDSEFIEGAKCWQPGRSGVSDGGPKLVASERLREI